MAALSFKAWGGPDGPVVRQVDGVPEIEGPNGPLCHLMFSGGLPSLGKPVALAAGWNKIRYSGVAPCADPAALIQINLGGAVGTVQIRNFRLTEESDGKTVPLVDEPFADGAWERDWKFVAAEGTKAGCQASPDGVRVTVEHRTDFLWSVQLARLGIPVREGARYTVSFEVKSPSDGWPLTSYLMRTDPLRLYAQQDEEGRFFPAARMAAGAGVDIVSILVPRMPWAENPEDDAAQLKAIGHDLDRVRAELPGAKVIIRFGVEPPPWWVRRHPDQMQRWEDGTSGKYVSVASEAWLSDARAHVASFVKGIEAGWGDLVIGYAPAAQSTGEWYYPVWDHRDAGALNFSPPFLAAYQKWLAEKYGSIDRLNAAWRGGLASFAAVHIPTGAERARADLAPFRDPAAQRALYDFAAFEEEAMFHALDGVARAVKEAAGERKLALAFYGYALELPGVPGGIGGSGHLSLGRMLREGALDGVIDIVSYTDRGAKGSGALMDPVDSITAHGKILCTEDDSRTHLSASNAGYERTGTPDETAWALSRNLLRSLTHNAYTWKFDLYGQGWMEDAALWQRLGAVSRAYAATPPKPYASDVAVIVDEASYDALRPGTELTRPLAYDFRAAMARTGVADPTWWLLDDAVAGRVPPHKLTIFLNAFLLSASQREALVRSCSAGGGTVLWMYAPGYLGESGEDFPGMEALTGFRFARCRLDPGSQGMAVAPGTAKAVGATPRFPAGLDDYFSVEPAAGVEVLGCFPGPQGGVAIASREWNGFRSVFCAAPQLTPEFLAGLAKSAGVWSYAPEGNIVLGDGRLLGITSPSGGPVPVSLPEARDVFTLDGTPVASAARRFVPELAPGETKIFVLKQP